MAHRNILQCFCDCRSDRLQPLRGCGYIIPVTFQCIWTDQGIAVNSRYRKYTFSCRSWYREYDMPDRLTVMVQDIVFPFSRYDFIIPMAVNHVVNQWCIDSGTVDDHGSIQSHVITYDPISRIRFFNPRHFGIQVQLRTVIDCIFHTAQSRFPWIDDFGCIKVNDLCHCIRKMRFFFSCLITIKDPIWNTPLVCSLAQDRQMFLFFFTTCGNKGACIFMMAVQLLQQRWIHTCSFCVELCLQRTIFRIISSMYNR